MKIENFKIVSLWEINKDKIDYYPNEDHYEQKQKEVKDEKN